MVLSSIPYLYFKLIQRGQILTFFTFVICQKRPFYLTWQSAYVSDSIVNCLSPSSPINSKVQNNGPTPHFSCTQQLFLSGCLATIVWCLPTMFSVICEGQLLIHFEPMPCQGHLLKFILFLIILLCFSHFVGHILKWITDTHTSFSPTTGDRCLQPAVYLEYLIIA